MKSSGMATGVANKVSKCIFNIIGADLKTGFKIPYVSFDDTITSYVQSILRYFAILPYPHRII